MRPANASAQDEALQLTVVEPTRLEQLEAIVAQYAKGFVAVASALWEIQRDELYKERGFRSFEQYIRERWQGFESSLSQQRLSQLAISGKVLENTTIGSKMSHLSTNSTGKSQQTMLPSNERQTRELARAPEAMQGAVWERAQELARAEKPPAGIAGQFHVPGRVAARHVEWARHELCPVPTTAPEEPRRNGLTPGVSYETVRGLPEPEPVEVEHPATYENFQSAVYDAEAKVWLITAHVQELERDIVIPVPAHALHH